MIKNIFERDAYLSRLSTASEYSNIVVVTGLRKVGKSTLMNDLFLPKFMVEKAIPASHVLMENIASWENENKTLEHLKAVLESKIQDDSKHLVLLDEIQMISGDYPSYLRRVALKKNVLFCLTGSNSHGLSTDIAEAFGDSAITVPVFPLNYREILAISPSYPFNLYYRYGGLPDIVKMFASNGNVTDRNNYLDNVLNNIYIRDIYDHDPALASLGFDKVKNVLSHFSSYLTTEISIKKTIQTICDDFQRSRKRALTYEERNAINKAFNNLISDYEKSYLAYVFDEEKMNLLFEEPFSYKEQRKLYISDQGLLNRLSANSTKLNENLLENLVYLELRREGYKAKGLELSYAKNGMKKNGQIDFLFQNEARTNVYIQVVYTFTDQNFDREIDPLIAMNSGKKIIIFFEQQLFTKQVPHNIMAIQIEDFCKNLDEYCR